MTKSHYEHLKNGFTILKVIIILAVAAVLFSKNIYMVVCSNNRRWPKCTSPYSGGGKTYGISPNTSQYFSYAYSKIALIYTTQTGSGAAWNCLQVQ